MFNHETFMSAMKLFLITSICVFILAIANDITAPIIEKNSQQAYTESLKEVLPEAQDFQPSDFNGVAIPDDLGGAEINSLNSGFSNGMGVGYVVGATSPQGYGGNIKILVGIDNNMKVVKVKILESSETPGLGGKTEKPEFLNQFVGRMYELWVVKNKTKDMLGNADIVAVSSATISSKAVTKAVNAALLAAQQKHDEADKNLKAMENKGQNMQKGAK